MTVSQQTLTLEVGESATLTAKVTPEGVESTEVVWSSDNAAVATVDAATGEVKGVAVGSAVITAKSTISDKSGQCSVTVMPADILDVITDPVFKSYAQFCIKNVYEGWNGQTGIEYPAWDSDNDGKLTWREAAAVEYIDVLSPNEYSNKISSLAGIEYFTGLKALDCYNNKLALLDLSRNTELTSLNCSSNQLESLDVTKCTALTGFNCSTNQLLTLDVTNCTALTYLYCRNNQLGSLVVTQCTALIELFCDRNRLTELDASKMAEPENYNIYCGNQKDGGGAPQTLTLTLREEQKPRWNREWASNLFNSGVVLAGE